MDLVRFQCITALRWLLLVLPVELRVRADIQINRVLVLHETYLDARWCSQARRGLDLIASPLKQRDNLDHALVRVTLRFINELQVVAVRDHSPATREANSLLRGGGVQSLRLLPVLLLQQDELATGNIPGRAVATAGNVGGRNCHYWRRDFLF